MDEVILVDEADRPIGVAEKLAAHRDGGALHRALSIFVFDSRGRMLLQRRSTAKYHFAGLWTNACCSHPRPGEGLESAAHRRLAEELGFDTDLSEALSFRYVARDRVSGLTEREFDHVLIGSFDGNPRPAKSEVAEIRWTGWEELLGDLALRPKAYSPWFSAAVGGLLSLWEPSRAPAS